MKKYTDVQGWIQPPEVLGLQKLSKGKVCLEIGSYKGKSTLIMAEGALSVTAVDTFRASGNGQTQMSDLTTYNEFMENISGYTNIDVHIGESTTVIPSFPDDYYDFIWVDGMHGSAYVDADIKVCWPKLKMGGVMAFHDYGWDGWKDGGPKKSIDAYFKEELQISGFVYVTKKRVLLTKGENHD